MTQSPRIVSIDCNIGSVKSTLLSHLKEHYKNYTNIIFLKEPVDEWESIKDSNGVSMLQKFYQDQKTYSFSFQMMAYISRLAILKEAILKHPTATIITERSLFTDKHVFAKMLYDDGNIEDVNYQIYIKWFDTFAEEYPIYGVIYVNADPKTCLSRIEKRSRNGENNIPIKYLENCHVYHNVMIHEIQIKKHVLHLDGNIDIHENPEIMNKWIQDVDKYVWN